MFKIIYIFIFSLFFSNLLYADEPTLAFLKSVNSNEVQKYQIGQYSFYCKPYGLITVDELYQKSSFSSECKKTLSSFYLKNKEVKFFSLNFLKTEQMYHLEFKKDSCLVFVQGERTLSEILLKNGLGFMKPSFKDHEYQFVFQKAQKNAKYEKKGLWSEDVFQSCISEIYK